MKTRRSRQHTRLRLLMALPVLLPVLLAGACSRQGDKAPATYQTLPVEKRDIVVAVEAAGVIEPAVTVELKSKASGQILDIQGETGQVVTAGTPLVQIDKRTPTNALAQATAQLEAAKARRSIAEAQSRRAAKLLEERIINDVDFEQAQLEAANAKAEVVRSQVAVETARIQLDDTDLRAPITGTIIEKLVEKGQVISSPTMDVGGGTLLLKMADLTSVQVRALVDETDIGKMSPGQAAQVTVTAYPNQPFAGKVQKIEPQATANQTVTTFAVLIVLKNDRGLLRPGMNAEVSILVTERRDVLAVPTAALRTDRDLKTSAALVGLDAATAAAQLKANALPDQPRGATGTNEAYRFSNRYWVFVSEGGKPVARPVVTGITDLDYSEVLAGLKPADQVYLLPSSGLVETQQRFQQQMRNMTGMPGMTGGQTSRAESRPESGREAGQAPSGRPERPRSN
ncbi:MAG: efflux RND transporter periplasmic adaptor subunit [Chromatiales bacterium]|nr:efflux RND transporter periplasmic adaptor subunit [Chromatiales bacterium]